MPSRILREGILDSAAVNALSFPAEVFYRRLMSAVDDFGRFDGRPAVLRSRLYALKLDAVREADVTKWAGECERVGLIARYAVDGKPYVLLPKLGPARAKVSKFPPPPTLAGPPEGDVNGCAQTRADVNGCAQVNTPVNGCAHVRPYSGSDSGSSSDPGSDALGGAEDAPPDAGKKPKAAAGAKAAPEAVPIPPGLDAPEFRAAWADWLAARRAQRKPLTEQGARTQLASLVPIGPAGAVACVRFSIANDYQGLFPQRREFQPGAKGGPAGGFKGKGETQDQYALRVILAAAQHTEGADHAGELERDDPPAALPPGA